MHTVLVRRDNICHVAAVNRLKRSYMLYIFLSDFQTWNGLNMSQVDKINVLLGAVNLTSFKVFYSNYAVAEMVMGLYVTMFSVWLFATNGHIVFVFIAMYTVSSASTIPFLFLISKNTIPITNRIENVDIYIKFS